MFLSEMVSKQLAENPQNRLWFFVCDGDSVVAIFLTNLRAKTYRDMNVPRGEIRLGEISGLKVRAL